jgi:hypothetical protein
MLRMRYAKDGHWSGLIGCQMLPNLPTLLSSIPAASWVMAWAGSVLWAYGLGSARRKEQNPVVHASGYAVPLEPMLYERLPIIMPEGTDEIDNIMRRMRETEADQYENPLARAGTGYKSKPVIRKRAR